LNINFTLVDSIAVFLLKAHEHFIIADSQKDGIASGAPTVGIGRILYTFTPLSFPDEELSDAMLMGLLSTMQEQNAPWWPGVESLVLVGISSLLVIDVRCIRLTFQC
jgi:hypothetical protein